MAVRDKDAGMSPAVSPEISSQQCSLHLPGCRSASTLSGLWPALLEHLVSLPWVLEGSPVCVVHTHGTLSPLCPGPDSLSRLEPPLDLRSWYNRWRICCDRRLLLKWQQLQALHQHEPLAPGRGASPPAPLLPFNLLTLLQAVLRVMVAIR